MPEAQNPGRIGAEWNYGVHWTTAPHFTSATPHLITWLFSNFPLLNSDVSEFRVYLNTRIASGNRIAASQYTELGTGLDGEPLVFVKDK